MILLARLLSAGHGGASVLLAAVTFAIGLAVGASIGPVTASRGDGERSLASAPAAARLDEAGGSTRMAHPAEVLRVLDGDTFEARVHLWPGLYTTTRIRLRGIDAPELKSRCAEERAKAAIARDALRAVLDQGEVGIARVTLDKYGGRVVADALTQATPDVSAALLRAGLVRAYAGGRRESWCGGDPAN
jgi:endonuclease YncB( thermonuclease family)